MTRTTKNIMDLSEEMVKAEGIDLYSLYENELYIHSENVAHLSVALGMVFGLNIQELLDLGVGGLLHDYGKAFIEANILYKPDRLSNMEFYLIQGHPSRGYRELKAYNFNDTVMQIVLNHHEKLTGQGYPIGKHNLDFLVQIVTVADIFDAVHSKRSYHEERSYEKTFEIVKDEKGLNPIIVEALKTLIENNYKKEGIVI